MQRTYFDALRRSPTHEGLGHDDRKWASSARGRQLRLDQSLQSPFSCGIDKARTVSSVLHWRGSSKGVCLSSGTGLKGGHQLRSPSVLRVNLRRDSQTCGEYAMAQGGRMA